MQSSTANGAPTFSIYGYVETLEFQASASIVNRLASTDSFKGNDIFGLPTDEVDCAAAKARGAFIMEKQLIHQSPGLVEVTYHPELAAIYLKWFSEYDEGTRVRDAVLTALDWVRNHNVRHWVVDVSTSPHGLSDADYQWVSGNEFRLAIMNSTLRKFVLLPPLPESGQDDAWVIDWEANTLANFGDHVSAKVCQNIDEATEFLSA